MHSGIDDNTAAGACDGVVSDNGDGCDDVVSDDGGCDGIIFDDGSCGGVVSKNNAIK